MKLTKRKHLVILLSAIFLFGGAANKISACPGDGTANYKAASEALISAAAVILNQQLQPANDCTVSKYITLLKAPPYSMQTKYNEGLKFGDAAAFLKSYLSQKNDESFNLREKVIKDAVYDALGREPNLPDVLEFRTDMGNQKAWYSTIVLKLTDTMNQNGRNARDEVVLRVYRFSYGRHGREEDFVKWGSRKENFRQMINDRRAFLHSSAGYNDYYEAVERAVKYNYFLENPNVAPGSINDQKSFWKIRVQQVMPEFDAKKAIFSEMIKGSFIEFDQKTDGNGNIKPKPID